MDQLNHEEEEPRKRSALRVAIITILLIFFVVVGILLGIAVFVTNALNPADHSEGTIIVEVDHGMNSGQIARILEDKGLIRNDQIFTYYLRYKNEGSRFQAGEYEMQPGITLDEIIEKLNSGDTIEVEMMRFTIPEGFTLLQMADKLSAEHIIDRDIFLNLLESPELFSTKYIEQIPEHAGLKHRMEGYLFPETYEMTLDSTEKEIIERMLIELERKLAKLPAGWEKQLEVSGLTFHEMMTIASLIEREVVVDAERPIVAGVIYNRLAYPMRLQIDAAIQYALDKPKERLYHKDLEIDSPYNTYENDGIPPGPIASPSLQSIKAALYPQETPFYYYVTKKDGTQEHLFAVTLTEHNKNIQKSKQ